jgi:hypothetical protein
MAFEMVKGRAAVAADAEQYFDSDRQGIIDATMGCPTSSIFIEFDDGRIVSSADYDQSKGPEQLDDL